MPNPPDVDLTLIEQQVLPQYGLDSCRIEPLGNGLIHQTFSVTRGNHRWVLQRVSPVFAPEIHDNIRAVTLRLAERGMVTPQLQSTQSGEAFVRLAEGGGLWRLSSYVDGNTFSAVQSEAQAHAAGELVARFHAALSNLDHHFVGLRAGVHDTVGHVTHLREALATRSEHRLHADVSTLAQEICDGVDALPPLPTMVDVIIHGDLKLDNVLFAGLEAPASEQAVCLLDLDTVGPGSLAYELGDALRSWCNRGGEGAQEAWLDLAVFRAALDGYLQGRGRAPSNAEARALLLGCEWVSLELAARFAADALLECYFGWDATRFPARGEHNLLRARGQWSLHRAFVTTRTTRAAALGITP